MFKIEVKQDNNKFYVDLPRDKDGFERRASFNTSNLEMTLTFSREGGAVFAKLYNERDRWVSQIFNERTIYGKESKECPYFEALREKREEILVGRDGGIS